MLSPEEMIDRLRRERQLVHEIHLRTDIPQIQSILRHADQNLHWALWNLGEIDELRPDLPGSIVAPSPRRAPKVAPAKAKSKSKARARAGKR